MRNYLFILAVFLLTVAAFSQETIGVSVQGISDGVKNSKRQDRDEAILDAKLKAIERAGVSIEAVTTMENFKLKQDWVESKAQAVILPGFNIIDVGYGADGLYHVVLTGKVSKGGGDIGDSEGNKKFRMAKLLLEKDKARSMKMLRVVVNDYGNCSAADDALYYLVINENSRRQAEEYLLRLKAYHPDCPYIKDADDYVANWNENIINRLDLKFVTIPAGSFMMGSNSSSNKMRPVHKVNIKKTFQILKMEVSQAQWQALMGNNPSFFKGNDLPVECVSWNYCQDFIRKLNQIDPGKGYRLPTEAEWEYACRAGTKDIFYIGKSTSDLNRVGWYKDNSGSKTHSVGMKIPNAWDLYDMLGNVREWCQDWYHNSYNGAPVDGSPWNYPAGKSRILRGGSWHGTPDKCRSDSRGCVAPSYKDNDIGFRLVRNP